MAFSETKLEQDEFVELLRKMIGHSEQVQNNPPEFTPTEDLVANEVVEYLKEWTKSESNPHGALEVRKVTFVEGRPNVIIKYQGTDPKKVVSFVGSHMDVVPADRETWNVDPFSLTVEDTEDGDKKLWGRGVTDCLGHVALTCNLLKQLAITRPKSESSLVVVFIANEECSDVAGVGIDELEKQGELDSLKYGPLYWVDSADFGPTLGTGAAMVWDLKAEGKLFHSGVPQMAINSISLANEATRKLEEWFHQEYKITDEESNDYLYKTGSHLKPTQISVPSGGTNQIPGECTVTGDIRMTPFYAINDVQTSVVNFIESIDVETLPTFGYGKFAVEEGKEKRTGKLSIKFRPGTYDGVAVDKHSPGYKALHKATEEVRGEANPFSLLGSLPIIGGLKRSGFDVQVMGFGRMSAYHANNEYGMLNEFAQGYEILVKVLTTLG